MNLADDVSFEIYFGKIGENKFQKNHSGIYQRNFPRVPKIDDRNFQGSSIFKSVCFVYSKDSLRLSKLISSWSHFVGGHFYSNRRQS